LPGVVYRNIAGKPITIAFHKYERAPAVNAFLDFARNVKVAKGRASSHDAGFGSNTLAVFRYILSNITVGFATCVRSVFRAVQPHPTKHNERAGASSGAQPIPFVRPR
jgi:hypothetical protein